MSRIIRFSLLAAAATALVACGGGAKLGGGKEGAAKALFEASQPAGKGGNSNSQSLLKALASGVDTTGNLEVSVNCSQGGSVKLKLDLTGGSQSGTFKYEIEYNSCNEDGANKFNGKMTMEMSFVGVGTSLEIAMRLKGKIEISGEIDDFIDADVTETIAVSATSATSGTVTIKLNGSIKTSEGSYTYTNETVTITVDGGIPADNGKS
jgi:hypothetical protein